MSNGRTTYDKKFRAQAVRKARQSNNSTAATAKILGIDTRTLKSWLEQTEPALLAGDGERMAARPAVSKTARVLALLTIAGAIAAGFWIWYVAGASPQLMKPPTEIYAAPTDKAVYRSALIAPVDVELHEVWSIWQRIGFQERSPQLFMTIQAIMPDAVTPPDADLSWQVRIPKNAIRYRTFRKFTDANDVNAPMFEYNDWNKVSLRTLKLEPSLVANELHKVDGVVKLSQTVFVGLEVDLGSSLRMGYETGSDNKRMVWGISWTPSPNDRSGELKGYEGKSPPTLTSPPALDSTSKPFDVMLKVCNTCFPSGLISDGYKESAPGTYYVVKPYNQLNAVNFRTQNPPWSWLVPWYRWVVGIVVTAAAGFLGKRIIFAAFPSRLDKQAT